MMRRYPWERPVDKNELVAGKSHFVVEKWGKRWTIIVRRIGHQPDTMFFESEGQLNRARQRLSDEGLIGFTGGRQ